MEDEDWMAKLQSLRFLKTRHERLEEVTSQLKDNHKQMASEEKLVDDFRAELALLEQEKQSHVEILRLINKDIEDMNGILKKSQECRQNLSKKQDQCFEEYIEVKDDVDRMRRSFDIESVADLSEEGIQIPANLMRRLEHAAVHFPHIVAPPSQQESYGAFHPCMPGFGTQHHPGQGSILSNMMGSNPLSIGDSGLKISQRAPPMKRCPNCGQDIHRNAPICPICKSKSHSKNPKKSKNKKQT